MSTPESEMANLNLGGPQVLSPRQAGQQRRRAREAQERAQQAQTLQAQQHANIQPLTTQPNTMPNTNSISSISNITYNNRSLNAALHSVAADAFAYPPKYDVEKAFEQRDDTGPFYAFQIKKSETVRIHYTDIDGRPTSISCSCHLCREFGLCDHIFQIQDSLNAELGDEQYFNSTLHLDRESIEARLHTLSPQIGRRLHSLPDAINFPGEIESESEADPDDLRDLQDILSVLDDGRLPEEFDEDFMEDVPSFERSMAGMVVPGNPFATLWGLAKYDVTFFTRLRNAVTKDLCERDFIAKLAARAHAAFDTFEQYVETGPQLRLSAVQDTAQRLRRVLDSIKAYLNTRAPSTPAFHRAAAELVVGLLRRASQRDRDVYLPRPAWLNEHTATTQAPSSSDQRNLFANLLIGRGRTDRGTRQDSSGAFALDALSDGRLRSLLRPPQRRILEDIHANLNRRYGLTAGGRDGGSRSPRSTAGRAYVAELRTLLDTLDERDVPGVVDPVASPPPQQQQQQQQRQSATRRRPSNLEESDAQRRRVQ